MSNIFRRFLALIPDAPLLIGTVTAVNADGTTDVTLLDGSPLRVRGEGTVGGRVFVRDGAIEGDAPALALEQIEV